MTSEDDLTPRPPAPPERSAPSASPETAGRPGMNGQEAAGQNRTRLVVSWLIVVVPLVYGIYQTISKTLPLFGG